jgi:hypothetical protein
MLIQITNDTVHFGSLSCQPEDYACACKSDDFGYGMRDCSMSECTDLAGINAGIDLANAKCGRTIVQHATVSISPHLLPSRQRWLIIDIRLSLLTIPPVLLLALLALSVPFHLPRSPPARGPRLSLAVA